MKKLLLVSLMSSMLVSFSSSAHFQRPPMPEAEIVHSLRSLDLSKSQQEEIKLALKTFRTDSVDTDLRKSRRPAAFDESTGEKLDDATLVAVTEEKLTRFLTRRLAAAKLQNQIFNLLTDEQQAELASVESEKASFYEAKKSRKNRKEKPLPFSNLDLTAAQQDQIAALVDAQQSNHAQLHALMQAFSSEEQAIIRQAEFNDDAWQALTIKYQRDLVEQLLAKAKARQQLLGVLTDEQQAELKEKREWRHGPKQRDFHPQRRLM
ncbi:hypothetical protein CA267_006980 [Alteromonas pelagimontana]|uniref:Periplasmic heavy metal sensor n=1 Tax=Alteromonas pelagimontana TaxID=1858656 RepID=A0A6M4MBE9_9ALTE|nr:Spy/CpxP family protein refolding chaperone [Alteromonas pelagimontana]QJR80534.1 hypothetical protein CA267_006980 [Alteromonas pelagimontana]